MLSVIRVLGILVGVAALLFVIKPVPKWRITRLRAALLAVGALLLAASAYRVSDLFLMLAFFAFGALLFGLINLAHPLARLGIRTRKQAAVAIGAAFVAIVAFTGLMGAAVQREPKLPQAPKVSVAEPRPVAGDSPGNNVGVSNDAKNGSAGTGTAVIGASGVGTMIGGTGTPPAPAPTEPTVAPTGISTTIVSVVDGDTVKADVNGKLESIRLIGVDTPETKHPTKGVQPYGPEASAYTTQRLTNQQVRLELDVEERDHYGRLLAYVWLGNELVNATLVKEGYARTLTIPPNVKYVDRFVALQREAEAAGRGLWGLPVTEAAPAPAPKPAPQPAPAPASKPTPAPSTNLRFDPHGPDRDCKDFRDQAEAQAFYVAAGGPARDPHKLDRDHDGIACESN